MSNDESSFKKEFRKALEEEYKSNLLIWTHTDSFRSGLPDIGAHMGGWYFPIEAKFISELPKRETTPVLKHELSASQASFLEKVKITGGHPIILIGLSDIALAIPFSKWPRLGDKPCNNIGLSALFSLHRNDNYTYPKIRGKWQVNRFFEKILQHY